MTREQLLNYFLNKPGTFDDDDGNETTYLNLASESVCKIYESSQNEIDIKCDLELSKRLRNKYKTVVPGERDGEFQWNRILLNSEIPDGDLYELIDISYDEILTKLPEEEQEEILDFEL